MNSDRPVGCPDCDGVSRRAFLATASATTLAAALPISARADQKKIVPAETTVKELYSTLTADQRKVLCFSWDHPLRSKVDANWNITEPKVSTFSPKQQDLIEMIVRGLTSEEGYAKFIKQMNDDDPDGFGGYRIAIFGKPGESKLEFVMTGRHMTMRADGNSVEGAAFGGPMFYGHAASGFNEKPDHPGNVFWYQAKRANEVFKALDPKQRKVALVDRAPAENQIKHRPGHYVGLAVSEMTSDQKDLVKHVMGDLLSPYRKQDGDEVIEIITANGGLDKIHLAFFQNDKEGKNADVGKDGVWDVWRLEGPGFVWHFRGSPHVHTWVNVAKVMA